MQLWPSGLLAGDAIAIRVVSLPISGTALRCIGEPDDRGRLAVGECCEVFQRRHQRPSRVGRKAPAEKRNRGGNHCPPSCPAVEPPDKQRPFVPSRDRTEASMQARKVAGLNYWVRDTQLRGSLG